MARPAQSHFDPNQGIHKASRWRISDSYDPTAELVLHHGDSLSFLRTLPDACVGLVVSSPPYNVGKEYEVEKELDTYLEEQVPILQELARVLSPEGSICWQIGNYVQDAESFPLDIFYYPLLKKMGFKLRNRIVWQFGHGVHTSKRFSPRYETLLWFTKGNEYVFNLDRVRIASKYPGKRHYKGPKAGQPSGNPLGKNPSDLWNFMCDEWEAGAWEIPNVKAAHPEKTIHPCQFPVELVERCVLALTNELGVVLDPFAGVGSTAIAALKNGRRAIVVEKEKKYIDSTRSRIAALAEGKLVTRPIGKAIMTPNGREKWAQVPTEWKKGQVETIY